jgi:RNA polymerase sigma-70 factor (ECF subfamily)
MADRGKQPPCYTAPQSRTAFMTTSAREVTELLNQWASGDQAAGEKVVPLVYQELRRIARRSMRGQDPSHTLQTTALVHEAYLRLTGDSGRQWKNRAHFFGVAAKAMRHVLVDYARARARGKRGGQYKRVRLEDAGVICGDRMPEVIALDDALTALSKLHARQSQVVELRFFGGCSVEETAETLNISLETVMRDWRAARAWLYRELERTDTDEHRDDA